MATMHSVRHAKYPSNECAANSDQHGASSLIQKFARLIGRSAILRGSHSEQLRFLTERLAESCLRQLQYANPHARRLTHLDSLPLVLREIATRCATEECAWFAWTNDQRTWFATARILSMPLGNDAATRLRFWFYEEDGRLASSGVWAFSFNSGWTLTEI